MDSLLPFQWGSCIPYNMMPVYPGALRFARHSGATFSEATYGHSLLSCTIQSSVWGAISERRLQVRAEGKELAIAILQHKLRSIPVNRQLFPKASSSKS